MLYVRCGEDTACVLVLKNKTFQGGTGTGFHVSVLKKKRKQSEIRILGA